MASPEPQPRPQGVATTRRAAPTSSRAVVIYVVTAFIGGGVLATIGPFWAVLLVGLLVGVIAMYGLRRFDRSHG